MDYVLEHGLPDPKTGSEMDSKVIETEVRGIWHASLVNFNLGGSYRKLLARPGKDISFEIRVYNGMRYF